MAADFSRLDGDTLMGVRVKTGQQYTTVILEPVREILKRYHNKLPRMTYDHYLKMLKPIAEMCGIHKDVATHTGRHTFATTITLQHGVPIEVVSKMLGHKSIKTTQIYAKVQNCMVQDQAEALAVKFAFCKALSKEGLSQEAVDAVKAKLGIPGDSLIFGIKFRILITNQLMLMKIAS